MTEGSTYSERLFSYVQIETVWLFPDMDALLDDLKVLSAR
jgi:hypothetical protein